MEIKPIIVDIDVVPITETIEITANPINIDLITDAIPMTANVIAPVICASLPAALTKVSNGQLSMFGVIWSQIMSLGGATAEMRVKWGYWAEGNNLPTAFVEIIKFG